MIFGPQCPTSLMFFFILHLYHYLSPTSNFLRESHQLLKDKEMLMEKVVCVRIVCDVARLAGCEPGFYPHFISACLIFFSLCIRSKHGEEAENLSMGGASRLN